ncbi:unnamed protein product [Closterium sp. Naga37s-1]|nr:unnamed protein product [Closterium sp. Naga37s-1]
MGSHTLTAPVRVFSWTARLLELVFLALLITFIAYLSKDQTAAPLAVYGGLSACFNCDNGWNWHVLLMGIAFGIAMTESLLTFCSASLRATGYAKWVHLAWQTIALILTAVAMAAIIVAKGTEHKHMYSVHTYCGVLTLALFAVQFFWGLCAPVLFKSCVFDDLQCVLKNSEKHPAVCHSVCMPAALFLPRAAALPPPRCSSLGPLRVRALQKPRVRSKLRDLKTPFCVPACCPLPSPLPALQFFWALCASVLFKSCLSESSVETVSKLSKLHAVCSAPALSSPCITLQFFWGLCAFVLFKSRLSEATRYQMGTYHILLGKFTYYAGIGTCVVSVAAVTEMVAALLVLALTGHGQDQGQATKLARLEHPDPPTPAHFLSANATAKPNRTLVPPQTVATGAASSLPAGVLSDSAVPRQYLAGAAAVGGSGSSGDSASVQAIYAKLTGRQVVPARGDPKAYGFLNATIHRDSNGLFRLEYKVIIIGLSRDAPPRKMSAHRGRKGEAGAHHDRLLDLPCGTAGRRAGHHAADSASLTVTCAGAVGGSAEELRAEAGRGAGEHEAGKGDRYGNGTGTGSTSNEANTGSYFASSERDQQSLREAVRVILQEPESYYVTVSTTHYAGGAIRGQLGRVFGQEE